MAFEQATIKIEKAQEFAQLREAMEQVFQPADGRAVPETIGSQRNSDSRL